MEGSESKQMDDGEFNLKEWALRARRITRENTAISRRFSASNLREEPSSFPSNVTVSSTASSPGYTTREEIDPSTYSFTTALRALQAKTVYTWELQPRDGLILHSKWNEAEKYISNPLSGQVPLECLSAKTLSGRSFRGLTTRITMSAPLIYPSQFHPNPPINHHKPPLIKSNEKRGTTRDVGTQSTPVELSSSSPTPAPTPSIQERCINNTGAGDSSSLSIKSVETNETEERERNGGEREQKQKEMMSRGRGRGRGRGGCLSLRGLWMRTQTQRQREKERATKDNNNNCRLSTFLHHFNGCTSKQSNFVTK